MEQSFAHIAPLLHKYDVPVPRYTSYPTAPHWNSENFSAADWQQAVKEAFVREGGELCLYIHLPFCEELCTYCACNKRITKNHAVEGPYLQSLLREWQLYLDLFPEKPVIREIHLGGGTPTFFAPENLRRLIEGILQNARVAPKHEFSVEVHPNYTTFEHLKALRETGFNRISLGIQDFDPVVQHIINRVQSFEQTQQVAEQARSLGYESLNVDLIYGLPRQSTDSIRLTIEKIRELKPERIAWYSYAHVPWKSKGQRRYTDADLPDAGEKIAMYSLGYSLLHDMGYESIGMDHFALPEDALLRAYKSGQLHRNFMGYTTTNHKLLVGLGVSSIGDTWNAFAQNEKTVEAWQERVNRGEWPLANGYLLNGEDLRIRRHILDLMCLDTTEIQPEAFDAAFVEALFQRLAHFEADGLIRVQGNHVQVLPKGKLLIRNICSAFDRYLQRAGDSGTRFSKAI